MAGNKEGGIKTRETNLAKYGKDYYKRIGAKGGSQPTDKLKGFAANPELASTVGKIGGTISRRRTIDEKAMQYETL